MSVLEFGPADGEPLVVLHGGPGETHHCLRPHLDRLASAGRRVIYCDQRRGALGWRDHVADVEALRLARGVERIALCGFSWGSLLALLHATEHPESVERLLLISPPPLHSASGPMPPVTERPGLAELRAQLQPLADDPQGGEAARRARFTLRIAPYFVDPKKAAAVEPVDTDQATADAVWRSLGQFDVRPRLPVLRGVPALVIRGAGDPLPREPAAELPELLAAQLVELPDAGHAPFVEMPEPFFAAALPFLDRRSIMT
jgi:proline iminopeptidase